MSDGIEVRSDNRSWQLDDATAWSVLVNGVSLDVVAGEVDDAALVVTHLGQWCVLPGAHPVKILDATSQMLDRLYPVHGRLELGVLVAATWLTLTLSRPGTPVRFTPPASPRSTPAVTPAHGPTSMPRPTGTYLEHMAVPEGRMLTIGRDPGVVDIALDGLDVEGRHATVRRSDDGLLVNDVSRSAGITVDGQPTGTAFLETGQSVGIGHFLLTATIEGVNWQRVGTPPVLAFEAVTARYENEKTRDALSQATFRLDGGGVLAVVGPSGAGKSTLCKVIVGDVRVVAGRVVRAERSQDSALPQHLVSYVPQAESVIFDLTVRDTLGYVARLRTHDSTRGQRAALVESVLADLELGGERDNLVARLSGGQRKRVSIAMELLSKPVLLVLDEPTSGLDEGLDRRLMTQLRELSRDFACVVVTHSMVNLDQATSVVAINSVGKVAFQGSPHQVLPAFCAGTYAEVMDALRQGAQSRNDAPVPTHPVPAPTPLPPPAPIRSLPTLLARELRRWWPRFRSRSHGERTTATRVKAVLRDRRLMHLLWAPLAIAGVAMLTGPDGLAGTPADPNSRLGPTIMVLNFTAAFFATALSVPTLVGDFEVIRRERRWGVSVTSAVISRALTLSPVAFVQAAVALAILAAVSPRPQSALDVPAAAVFVVALGLSSLASCCLGLLISALSPTQERAVFGLMGTAVVQVVLTGLVIPFGTMASVPDHLMSFVSYAVPTRWGAAAMAATTDLHHSGPGVGDAMWTSDLTHVVVPLIALVTLAVLFVAVAAMGLSRRLKAME